MVVARDEVSPLDVIGASDRCLRKPQVGLGRAQGLLRIVFEICLTVHVGRAVDDIHGALVGADGTVASKAPEFTAYKIIADNLERLGLE